MHRYAPPTEREPCTLCDKWQFGVVGSRKGDYELHLVLAPGCVKCGYNKKGRGGADPVERVVVYSEEEWSKLSHNFCHTTRVEGKEKTTLGFISNAARGLWPRGSNDNVAMNQLGAWAMGKYYGEVKEGARRPFWRCVPPPRTKDMADIVTTITCLSLVSLFKPTFWAFGAWMFIGMFHRKRLAHPKLRLMGDPHSFAAPAPIKDDHNPVPLEGMYDFYNKLILSNFGFGLHPGVTVGAKGEMLHECAYRFSIIGPVPHDPLVYEDTAAVVDWAVSERILANQLPYTGGAALKVKIGLLTSEAMSSRTKGLFSEAKIKKWADKFRQLTDLCSTKWSPETAAREIEQLMENPQPNYYTKLGIKCEPMQGGKIARIIFKDGNPGQVMALLTCCCFEHLLFAHLDEHSIKHRTRSAAFDYLCQNGTLKGDAPVSVLEGDGKAWDACCNTVLRGSEQTILRFIFDTLTPYAFVPDSWEEAHLAHGDGKKLRAYKAEKWRPVHKWIIKNQRRSGHRGTSCLNFWINVLCWSIVLLADPTDLLVSSKRRFTDIWGTKRWLYWMFEGDDSIIAVSPPLTAEQLECAHATWKDFGINMKLFQRESVPAEFCGTWFETSAQGLTGLWLPDLPRCMANSGVSSSRLVLDCILHGDVGRAQEVAAASYAARAESFWRTVPSVSRVFLRYARALGSSGTLDRESSMQVYGAAVDETVEKLIERITSLPCAGPQEELDNLRKLGWECTDDERELWTTSVWDPDHILSPADFREVLPATWHK